jgi:hypothetical protein
MISSVVFLIILAVGCWVAAGWISRLNETPEGVLTTGQITKVTQEDGFKIYYVQFYVGDELCEGSSPHYGNTQHRFGVGDTVDIEYYKTPHNGLYRVRVLADDLVEAGTQSVPKAVKLCRLAALVFGVLAIWCLIRLIFGIGLEA